MRRMNVVGLAVVLVVAWTCSGCGKKEEEHQIRDIRVNGLAEVKLVPDMLTVNIGVVTLDKDPLKSQSENDRAVKTILAAAKQLGVAPEDVQTGYVWLGRKESESREGPAVFEGYEAATVVTVVLRDLTKYNALVTEALKAGANRVGGLTFGYLKEEEKWREARMLAIKAAKQKAEDLAGQLGEKLGRPTGIQNEERPPQEQAYAASASTGGAGGFSPDEGTTLSAGQMVIRSEVEVTFELKD